MKEKFRIGEILALLILAGTGIAYYMETFTYRVSRFERTGGPAVYPRLILWCLFFFIGLRILQILLSEDKRRPFVFFNLFTGRKGLFFLFFALYILAMPYAGYVLGTTVYLVVASSYLTWLKEGTPGPTSRLLLRAAFFFLLTLGLYGFFVKFLDVMVPQGILAHYI